MLVRNNINSANFCERSAAKPSCSAGGRSDDSLLLLLHFICKYIQDMQYTVLLTQIAHRVLDVYGAQVRLPMKQHLISPEHLMLFSSYR